MFTATVREGLGMGGRWCGWYCGYSGVLEGIWGLFWAQAYMHILHLNITLCCGRAEGKWKACDSQPAVAASFPVRVIRCCCSDQLYLLVLPVVMFSVVCLCCSKTTCKAIIGVKARDRSPAT